MIRIHRCTTDNADFRQLVAALDAYLAKIDGEENVFYSQFNKIEFLDQVVVLYENDRPLGCGALKPVLENKFEVKRMFTSPEARGRGIASQVLGELESWARELGAEACVLETGQRQKEALALYTKLGYQRIPNYPPYVGVENSVCFEKKL
ncbi:GNAT family N-acetyltransferase [Algoriphagus namhaensis]